MHKKYKIVIPAGLLVILLLAAFSVLSAQEHSQTKDPNHTDILSQSQVKTNKTASVTYPVIEYPEDSFDFGNVKQESEVSHIFKVHNTGTAPLKILNAKAS